LNIHKIIETASEFGLKIGKLDDFDENILQDLHQAITEYKENRNLHTVDYLW